MENLISFTVTCVGIVVFPFIGNTIVLFIQRMTGGRSDSSADELPVLSLVMASTQTLYLAPPAGAAFFIGLPGTGRHKAVYEPIAGA